eukprot:1299602-Pyramimonas_sp.AAC.1
MQSHAPPLQTLRRHVPSNRATGITTTPPCPLLNTHASHMHDWIRAPTEPRPGGAAHNPEPCAAQPKGSKYTAGKQRHAPYGAERFGR